MEIKITPEQKAERNALIDRELALLLPAVKNYVEYHGMIVIKRRKRNVQRG